MMKDMKIIDLSRKEKPYDLEDSGFILITGITESNLNDAIKIAESARESEIVTIGIPASDDDMRRFSDIADAVIFSYGKSADISQRIAEELSAITEIDGDISTVEAVFRNAGTVYYGSGVGDDVESALRKATEMCGDIHGAKVACVKMSVPPTEKINPDTICVMEYILKEFCGRRVRPYYTFDYDEKFTAKIFALMYDAGYVDWRELFAYESKKNIAAMIENGLDERTKTRLGTEKLFFAACMRFGTPELVRKFISKGHNPKELETDGIFPGDVLADCLKKDIRANNTAMTDILLESGISLGENCVTPLVHHRMNPKILRAFINYGWNVNSRDEGGMTLLMRMLMSFPLPIDCVKTLVEAGADVNTRDKDGHTPLMSIAEYADSMNTGHEILKYLLAKGADINATANDGTTPFTHAARDIYCCPDIVRTFLNAWANVNAEETYENGENFSVLDVMFAWSARAVQEPEEKQIFLREVLPMMINAGAKFNPAISLPHNDNEYQYFRRNWKDLLTEDYALANKKSVRQLMREAIAEYDTETVREIIERISPEKLTPRNSGITPAEFFRMSASLAFRINDFPEAMINPSAQNTEIKRRLDKGTEILKIFQEAGITWPLVLPEGTELTYVINEEWKPRKNIDGMNPLSLCHSPEALKKVIASEKYNMTDALKEIAGSCESYYQPGEMMNILLANGADIHSLNDTWIGECLSHRGKILMLDNFQQAKFMAEIFRKHNLSDITTVSNTQHYDGWEKIFGGPLSCHMLSHLWEIVESGIDYGGEWANFRMLLASCWGSVNDIEDVINSGGNFNYKTWLGYTPLMYASIFNSPESVKFLIKKGADINARNIHGNDALSLAAMSDYNAGDSAVILIFAEFGADIHDGLMSRAVDAGNVDAVKVLLSLGAKLPGQNAVNNPEPETRNKKPCPKCGRIFSRANDYCPSCGYVLPVSERYDAQGGNIEC